MIEAVAWAGGLTGVAFASASVIKSLYGKRTCEFHDKVIMTYTSDIATIKHGLMLITTYITDKTKQEDRDLNKEMVDLMMGKKKEILN